MAPAVVHPTTAIDWKKLAFGLAPTNGHAKMVYKEGSGWGPIEFVKDPFMRLHVGSSALNYGQSVFEGLKAFRSLDGSVRVFRPDMNAERINHSAECVSMPPIDKQQFLDCVELAVAKNLEFVPPHGAGSLYVRPLYFASGETLILAPPTEYTLVVYVTPTGSLYGSASATPAVDAFVIDTFDRAAPMGTGSAKLAGNYAPTFKHAIAAKKAGYAITLHLDSATRTNIDEFSTSNFLAIIKKPSSTDVPKLVVPTSPSILKSITTASIIALVERRNWTVERRLIPFAEVKSGKYDEVAACGTAAAITPIKSITYHPTPGAPTEKCEIGNGKDAGESFLEILKELTGIQGGAVVDTLGWCWPAEGIDAAKFVH